LHPEVGAEERQHRQERHLPAVGDAARFEDREAAGAATLDELETEPALARPRLCHHAHRLPVPRQAALEGRLQRGHFGGASDELRESARPREVEPGAQRSELFERIDAERLAHALQRELPERSEREEALDEPCGVRSQIRRARLGQLLHALRQADGVPLRGVVHAQIVADPADHDFARVEPHARREAHRMGAAQLVRVSAQALAQMEDGEAAAFRVILVRDRRAEEGHDSIPGVLVHRPLEAVDTFGEDREEPIHDFVPLFGIDLLRELHRALHVGEQDGHLLPLAFESGLRLQDLLSQMPRRIVARRAR
jgi:hypothetical protein